ncbi:Toluene efflux pump periplasmic linker protein TtgA precursor [Vibrio aerogenes CECT 7868]|uniref:Toluene efflux pump periplasmic linker protein TtgA n=1 Tax=Vibrio aerogenes CECT 7868 TaxID=1216006 RepID=A0A1M5ZFY9_9VIBR|nr:efflux RND transporter periplasmic adaptor subunit [Vibrio aerogenes]SHI23176.1 Toluene efflux pump periplasmic linker protein TtgA precursor [Vibrio aerogenes CECT 7868]
MKKWTAVMLLIAILLFGSVIGFNLFKNKMIANFMANMPEPSYPVTVTNISSQDWTPTIEAIGFIEPYQGVTLTTESSGVIDSIKFESGDKAEKGQVLLTLDSKVEQATLRSSEARLPAAKAKFERYKGLYKRGSLSQESYDEAQASYLSLSADIESLKATIARRQIKAPFAGQVGIRNVYLGQYLQPGTTIVRLEDTSVMRLHFTIPQTEISRISKGQTVEISVDAYPDHAFKGEITAIEPAVSVKSGLVQIEANIPNSDGKLRSGMFAHAQIQLPVIPDQIIVPQTAITFTLYGDSVYVVSGKDDEKRVKQRVVKVGERRGYIAHILTGLKDGEEIVTSGQVRLSNGVKIHVVESDATAPRAETPML